jgi:hypothetical protein
MVMWFLSGGLLERFACTGYNAVFNYFAGGWWQQFEELVMVRLYNQAC